MRDMYEDAGEFTTNMLNKFWDINYEDSENYNDVLKFLNQAENFRTFNDGLTEFIKKHGYIEEDDSFGDEAPFDVGPEKFISYIKNATYVLTDSFHGTVFSILFNKKFVTFYRNNPDDALSKNSRIDSLLGLLGLADRVFSNLDIYKTIIEEIDYDGVTNKLNSLQAESRDYLKQALNSCENRKGTER